MGLYVHCMFNYVFFIPSSLPLLHSAIPTPCLNVFWHRDPYIFLCRKCFFLSCIYIQVASLASATPGVAYACFACSCHVGMVM